MCCTPTIRLLIVLTLPPCCRCPLNRGPAPRLLLPRSRLERSDIVRWHKREVPTPSSNVRVYGHSGKHILALSSSHFDPSRKSGGQVCCAAKKQLPVSWPHRLQKEICPSCWTAFSMQQPTTSGSRRFWSKWVSIRTT